MNRKVARGEASIPEGWQKVALGEFMQFKNGINADKSAYGQGTKFVNVMDIFRNRFLKKDDIAGMVQISDKQLSEYSVIHGDILFNRTSETREEIAYSTVYTGKETVTFGGFVIRGRQKRNLLLPDFAGYCFKNSTTRKEMIRRSQGAIRANIGQKDLNMIPVLIPPKHEQEKIVQILSRFDTAIEKTETLIATKRKQFEWLLKTLLYDQQDNPEWRKVKLVDACDVIVSSVDKKTFDEELPIKLCNYTDVYYNSTIDSRIDFMAATAKASEIEKFSIIEGDVIITKDSETPDDIGVPAYVKETINNLLCGYHLTILRPKEQMMGKYLYYALTSPRSKYDFYRFANGITRFGLTTESYQTIKIALPLLHEQIRLVNLLDTAKKEIEVLEQLTEQYSRQNRGLMQKLLTEQWKTRL